MITFVIILHVVILNAPNVVKELIHIIMNASRVILLVKHVMVLKASNVHDTFYLKCVCESTNM